MLLRMPQGVLQCVLTDREADVREADAVKVEGCVRRDGRAPGGAELHVQSVQVLARAAGALPVPIGKNRMNLSLSSDLSLRFVTLRNLRKRAVFKIQEGVVRGFRQALLEEGFTEIHSPKIVAQKMCIRDRNAYGQADGRTQENPMSGLQAGYRYQRGGRYRALPLPAVLHPLRKGIPHQCGAF